MSPSSRFVACILAALSPCAHGQDLTHELDKHFENRAADGFSGAVLIAEGDDVLLRAGYAGSDVAEHARITPQTGFDIGSLTKVFTAAAIYKLIAEGKLTPSTTLADVFGDVPEEKSEITIAQLVRHTSGLPDLVDARARETRYEVAYDEELVERDELVRRVMATELRSNPGETRRYSNLGYSLLGVVIEVVAGRPYEEYVREAILVPAGMNRTGYTSVEWDKADLAVGSLDGQPWGTPLDRAWLSDGPSWNLRAAGGMISTIDDLHRWVRALEEGTLLPPGIQDDFLQAMGVRANSRGVRSMGPAGSNGIFSAVYLWRIEERRLVIILANVDAHPAEDEIRALMSAWRRRRK